MNIALQSICPSFLEGRKSQVWGCDVLLSAQTHINVTAPSGTGKTSLVSILYGLLRDYSGHLQFDDRHADSFSRRQWAQFRQCQLSVMFQDLRLFDQLSCLDNVLLKAGQARDADPGWIASAFERLGLQSRMYALAGSCSHGEKQRVALIRALSQPFDWILLDEPFSHLDDECIRAMRELLLEVCDRNQAGMLVTSLAPDAWLSYSRTVAL